jgi:hypothetical protein
MACEIIRFPGLGSAICCSRGRRAALCQVPGCGRPHEKLCDWPLLGKLKGRTCSMRLCASHAVAPSDSINRDYCPAHAKIAAELPRIPVTKNEASRGNTMRQLGLGLKEVH